MRTSSRPNQSGAAIVPICPTPTFYGSPGAGENVGYIVLNARVVLMLSMVQLLLLALLATSALAQCPVYTVIIKGRVEDPLRHAHVRVKLLYAKDQPGESAETTVENGSFRLPIEFLSESTRPLLRNLKPKCDRKPRTVTITLLEGDEEQNEITLDFAHAFQMTDFSAYAPKSEVVLKSKNAPPP